MKEWFNWDVKDEDKGDAPLSQVEERKKICGSCESLNKYMVCKICGCFMPVKIRLGDWVGCPQKKW